MSRKKDPENNQPQSANTKKRKKKSFIGRFFGAIGTLMLVGILTAAMFVGIFLYYVENSLKGHVEVDLSEYTQEVSTELYYKDPDTGEWFMYQTLFANENRIWVNLEDVPQYAIDALDAFDNKEYMVTLAKSLTDRRV